MSYPDQWIKEAIEATGIRAYNWTIPRDAEAPFVRISPPSIEPALYLDGDAALPLADYVVEVYGARQLEIRNLWAKVKAAVANFSGEANGVTITSTWVDGETLSELEYETGEDMPVAYVAQATLHVRYRE